MKADLVANLIKNAYGIVLCIVVGICSVLLSAYLRVGAVAIAIILGIFIGNIVKPPQLFKQGIAFSEKHILSVAIALMGVNLNYLILNKLGYKSILVVVAALAVTIFSAVSLGRIFKIPKKLALLLGIGNAICGSSAIAATKQIVGATDEETGLSVAIVNFLGTLGIFFLPFIGAVVLNFTDVNSGMLIGNTLQAVGQVVAAGFTVSDPTGQTATIVKMTRILMLTPVVLILIFSFSRNAKGEGKEKAKKQGIPLFVIGFILFSLIPTLDLLPGEFIKVVSKISHYALITAMAGVGLKITFGNILRNGKSALLIGTLVFAAQIVFSSSMIYLFF